MGNVQRGDRQPGLQAFQLGAHVGAQPGLEVRDRFVHDEELRLAHDRSSNADALFLATAQVLDPPRQKLLNRQDCRRLANATIYFRGRQAPSVEGHSDVVVDG